MPAGDWTGSASPLCMLLHQAAARPIGRRVVAGLFRVVAVFAVAGDGGVDQAVIRRREVLISEPEFPQRLGLIIRDENIGGGDQFEQYLVSLGIAEIERDAFLIAIVEDPAIILIGHRHAGHQ